jgi:hypothetical protein
MNAAALTSLWRDRFGAPPIAHELRAGRLRPRWVRFHMLPGSKRYPQTAEEYATVLGRHNALLAELVGEGEPAVLLTTGYSDTPSPLADAAWTVPDAWHWRSVQPSPDDPQPIWWHLYGQLVHWHPGVFDALLRGVADDQASNVLILPVDRAAMYHPYDGGADLILPDIATRDTLRAKYRDWLSAHPAGL